MPLFSVNDILKRYNFWKISKKLQIFDNILYNNQTSKNIKIEIFNIKLLMTRVGY